MLKRIILGVVLLAVVSSSGCFTYNRRRNQEIWRNWAKDMQVIHADLDFLFAVDAPTLLDPRFR